MKLSTAKTKCKITIIDIYYNKMTKKNQQNLFMTTIKDSYSQHKMTSKLIQIILSWNSNSLCNTELQDKLASFSSFFKLQ